MHLQRTTRHVQDIHLTTIKKDKFLIDEVGRNMPPTESDTAAICVIAVVEDDLETVIVKCRADYNQVSRRHQHHGASQTLR